MNEHSNDEIAALLDKAADLLKNGGWIQHRLRNAAGAYCMYGALIKGAGEKAGSPSTVADAALRAVRRALPLGRHPIEWNDAPGRKELGVRRLLLKTARKLRAEA